jgi:hypothetical protein
VTYGPVTGDTGSPQPPPARVGLLVGLVVVLLVICGGVAFTGYRFVGSADTDRAAAEGPRWDPPVRTAGPALPAPVRSGPAAPSNPGTPRPSGSTVALAPPSDQAIVPAQGSLVPFGQWQAVIWPDQLRAIVSDATHQDLPEDLAAKYPGDVEVRIWIEIDNYTPHDLVINHAQTKLYYGPGRTPAVPFADPADIYDGISGPIEAEGSKLWGDAIFVVPVQYLSQLVFELRPRSGDAPAHFYGAAS